MNLSNKNTDVTYTEIEYDFYDQQVSSMNPLRAWHHVNRFFIMDMLVKANYREGMRIVDLGCGNCNWNTSLLPVHGVDINEGMLKFAHSKGRLSSYEISDFGKTLLENETVDIVVASEVLEHLQDTSLFLKEVKKILKPTGKFIASVPYDTPLSLFRPLFLLQCFFHGYILKQDYYKKQCGHIQHFSPLSLYTTLCQQGFVVGDIFNMRTLLIFAVAYKNMRINLDNNNYDDLTIILYLLGKNTLVEKILVNLLKIYPAVRIIVCNSGLKDDACTTTDRFADKNVIFLDNSIKKKGGLTASILESLKLMKTPYFLVMFADGQHPLHKVYEIYNILKRGYRVVVASRVRVKGWPLSRRVISTIATLLGKAALLLRRRVNFSYDVLSAFWGGDTYFVKTSIESNTFRFQKKGDQALFDILKILPKDTRVGEIFYEYQTKKGYEPRIKLPAVFFYMQSLFM